MEPSAIKFLYIKTNPLEDCKMDWILIETNCLDQNL